MKLRPILFQSEMVKALLAGTKTQTRRMVKPQPALTERRQLRWAEVGSLHVTQDLFPTTNEQGLVFAYIESQGVTANMGVESFVERFGKYKVGDVLWVRETFTSFHGEFVYRADIDTDEMPQQVARSMFGNWKPSLFMPFDACRLFLEVLDIRVERLQSISKQDCIAEGIDGQDVIMGFRDYTSKKGNPYTMNAYNSYASLWKSINGPESFESNPYVWVYTFKQVDKPLPTPPTP